MCVSLQLFIKNDVYVILSHDIPFIELLCAWITSYQLINNKVVIGACIAESGSGIHLLQKHKQVLL